MFSLIACIGKNREIGKKGKLVFSLPEDMNFFRETTAGHQAVMGYNTWKSLKKKLKNRTNIVIYNQTVPEADLTITDLPKFISEHQDSDEEIFIIGGGIVYREFLPFAKTLYLTEVNASAKDADTFFPGYDKSQYSATLIKKGSENGLNYSIIKYHKI